MSMCQCSDLMRRGNTSRQTSRQYVEAIRRGRRRGNTSRQYVEADVEACHVACVEVCRSVSK